MHGKLPKEAMPSGLNKGFITEKPQHRVKIHHKLIDLN